MKRIAIAAAGLLLCTAADEAPKSHDLVTNPEWIGQPSIDQLMAVFPKAASSQGIPGRGVVECTVTPQGFMTECHVISEEPAGLGFGAAALALAPLFKMRPAMRNGVPMAAKVRIPIRWNVDGNGVYRPKPRPVSPEDIKAVARHDAGDRLFIGDPVWEVAPTRAEVAAVTPAKLKETGQVVLDCSIDGTGLLINCRVVTENPASGSLRSAAVALSRKFRMSTSLDDGRSTKNGLTRFAILFDPPGFAPSAPTVSHPHWIRLPTPEDLGAAFPQAAKAAKVATGRGVVDCTVMAGGRLGECAPAGEEPAGLGFGAAALKLAPSFALSPWTQDGRPLDGARLQLPIRFEDPDAAPAAAPGK